MGEPIAKITMLAGHWKVIGGAARYKIDETTILPGRTKPEKEVARDARNTIEKIEKILDMMRPLVMQTDSGELVAVGAHPEDFEALVGYVSYMYNGNTNARSSYTTLRINYDEMMVEWRNHKKSLKAEIIDPEIASRAAELREELKDGKHEYNPTYLGPTDPNVRGIDCGRLGGQNREILKMLIDGPKMNHELAGRGFLKYTSRISDIRKHIRPQGWDVVEHDQEYRLGPYVSDEQPTAMVQGGLF